jgi:Tol biopolymer transport system component
MSKDRFARIRELFEAAQALPEAKRNGFLRQAAPEDPAIRDEVLSLLGAAPGAESLLESSPLSSNLRAGTKIAHFEIQELLGRGGMGEVYRARDSQLNRFVAIKVLPAQLARDPERVARFEREARAASAVNNSNIVVVHAIGQDNGVYWIATELVDGEPLNRVIERGPLPAKQVIVIAAQIADGLAAAHAAGIVHRDLKPANIMMTREGRVKILDFGLAKWRRLTSESTTLDLTDEGVVMGTAGYMSPEQVRGEELDQRSDLFSLGVILYEMLGGKRAFPGNSSVEVMSAILKQEPPELPAVAQAIDRIVRRCLEKDTARRFHSAADLAFALVSLSAPPESAAAPRRKQWPKWAAIAAGALATIAFAYRLGTGAAQQAAIMPEGTFRRLTNDPGLTTSAAISSDGKLVAYASDRADGTNLDIWVQQVDGGAPIRLTNDPADDDEPAFSPDGTQIAFRSERDGGGVYIAPALGGAARLFAPRGRHPRFSPDGHMLMYTATDPSISRYRLMYAQFPGGTGRPVAQGCVAYSPHAVWSPDSSRILFTGDCGAGGYIFVCTPGGKPVRSRMDFHQPPGSTIDFDEWLPNPSRVIFPMLGTEQTSIGVAPISIDGTRAEGAIRRLTFGIGEERHASAAGDGRMVFSSIHSDEHIWGLPIDGNGHATGAPKPLTGGWKEDSPSFSRDGQGLAFLSQSAGRWKLHYRDLKSGQQRELAAQNTPFDSPYAAQNAPFDSPYAALFSPDGRKIIFSRVISTNGTTAFYEMPVSGGMPERVSREEKDWKGIWDWAPDGVTLLFFQRAGFGKISQMEVGSFEETPFLNDPEYQVWNGRFSSDGRSVVFNAEHGEISRIFVVPFRKGQVPRSEWIAISDGPWDDKPDFLHDDNMILFASRRDGYLCIWGQRLGSDRHPSGSPFALYHSHQRRRSLGNAGNESSRWRSALA